MSPLEKQDLITRKLAVEENGKAGAFEPLEVSCIRKSITQPTCAQNSSLSKGHVHEAKVKGQYPSLGGGGG